MKPARNATITLKPTVTFFICLLLAMLWDDKGYSSLYTEARLAHSLSL
jgi:hypothetical protein